MTGLPPPPQVILLAPRPNARSDAPVHRL